MIHYQLDPKLKIKKIEEIMDVPVVITTTKFDEASAKEFRDSFTRALNTGQGIVPIVIDSFGGSVYNLLSMCATIRSSPVPVATFGTGKMMSAAAVLLSCGSEGYRFADPLSTCMIHPVSSWASGKVEECKSAAQESDRLNNTIFKIMSQNLGKEDNYLLKLIDEHKQAEWYLDADEMKKHNIINHIRIPSFKVKITVSSLFE